MKIEKCGYVLRYKGTDRFAVIGLGGHPYRGDVWEAKNFLNERAALDYKQWFSELEICLIKFEATVIDDEEATVELDPTLQLK